MIVTAIALATIAGLHQDKPTQTPIVCAIMGGNAKAGGGAAEYKGIRYDFCCPGCVPAFQKDPEAAIHGDKAQGKTIGTYLFDPITMTRILDRDAKATEDYNGVRYLFASDDEKKTFDTDPAKYTTYPAKEALFCPIEKQKISSYSAAGSYADYNGVRYYFCCGGCPAEFAKKPADASTAAAAYVRAPQALAVVADSKGDKADAFTAETYACKHCGREMSINSPDDKKSTCSVCGCGKTAEQCKPGG